ncbi:MAG: hypothetical protein JEZ00_14095 [Anaerolineaceae bacterium]|nr:hypothetical protein [Anaerolineaceae bacterium]
MKKLLFVCQLFLIASLVLSACSTIGQVFNPPPKVPPISENETWNVEVLSIETFNEPIEFICSDCDLTSIHSRLNLQDKKTYLKLSVKIINKSGITQTAPDINIGILLSSSVYGCGGLTLAGADYCLPSGMIRDGKNYVNYGINTPDFKNTLLFEPNQPDGEIVELIFIVKENPKYKAFYFNDLQPIDIKKIKAKEVK